MTAQIEPNPRQGVELDESWTWRDYLALSLSYALTAGVAVCLFFPWPPLIVALFGAAALTLLVGWVLEQVTSPGAHL